MAIIKELVGIVSYLAPLFILMGLVAFVTIILGYSSPIFIPVIIIYLIASISLLKKADGDEAK